MLAVIYLSMLAVIYLSLLTVILLPLLADYEVPTAAYTVGKNFLRAKGSNAPHKFMTFLRKPAVLHANEMCRKFNLFPNACDADQMPNGEPWNNFAEVLWSWIIFYCDFEGWTISSEMFTTICLYVFHGSFDNHKGRMWPVIRGIHRFTTMGRSRYMNIAPQAFSKLFALLKKEPELARYLDDRGEAKDVPFRYLAAVEHGIRESAKDIHGMGTNALRSPEDYKMVPAWKKREAYIAGGRHHLGTFGYEQWDHFLFEDYIQRHALAKTFFERHYHLSNGEAMGKLLPALKTKKSKVKSKSVAQHRKRVKKEVKVDSHADEADEKCVYFIDHETGAMVQVIDDSSDDE